MCDEWQAAPGVCERGHSHSHTLALKATLDTGTHSNVQGRRRFNRTLNMASSAGPKAPELKVMSLAMATT